MDYNTLISAAAPNKKNDEFNEKELEFLVNIKKELEISNGEITISK